MEHAPVDADRLGRSRRGPCRAGTDRGGAGRDGGVRLRLLGAGNAPAAARGVLTFADLAGAWRDRVTFRSSPDGLIEDVSELPPGGVVVVTVDTADGAAFEPLILGEPQ